MGNRPAQSGPPPVLSSFRPSSHAGVPHARGALHPPLPVWRDSDIRRINQHALLPDHCERFCLTFTPLIHTKSTAASPVAAVASSSSSPSSSPTIPAAAASSYQHTVILELPLHSWPSSPHEWTVAEENHVVLRIQHAMRSYPSAPGRHDDGGGPHVLGFSWPTADTTTPDSKSSRAQREQFATDGPGIPPHDHHTGAPSFAWTLRLEVTPTANAIRPIYGPCYELLTQEFTAGSTSSVSLYHIDYRRWHVTTPIHHQSRVSMEGHCHMTAFIQSWPHSIPGTPLKSPLPPPSICYIDRKTGVNTTADFIVLDWDVKVNAGSEFGIDVRSVSQQPALAPATLQLRQELLDTVPSLNADVVTVIVNYMPLTLAKKLWLVEHRETKRLGLFDPADGDWVAHFHTAITRAQLLPVEGQSLVYITACGTWSHMAVIDRLSRVATTVAPSTDTEAFTGHGYMISSVRLYNLLSGTCTHLPLTYPGVSTGRGQSMANLAQSLWFSYDCRIFYYFTYQTRNQQRALATTTGIVAGTHDLSAAAARHAVISDHSQPHTTSSLQLVGIRLSSMQYIAGTEPNAPRSYRASHLFTARHNHAPELDAYQRGGTRASLPQQPLMNQLGAALAAEERANAVLHELRGLNTRSKRAGGGDADTEDDDTAADEEIKASEYRDQLAHSMKHGLPPPSSSSSSSPSSPPAKRIKGLINVPTVITYHNPAPSHEPLQLTHSSEPYACTFEQLMRSVPDIPRACFLWMIGRDYTSVHPTTGDTIRYDPQTCVTLCSSHDRRRHLMMLRELQAHGQPAATGQLHLFIIDVWLWLWCNVDLDQCYTRDNSSSSGSVSVSQMMLSTDGGFFKPKLWAWFVPSSDQPTP